MQDKIEDKFVDYLFSKIHEQKDKGFSARIRKAESEATEAQSWSVLAKWTDLENLEKTRAYGMIGAAVSRSPFTQDGELGLGRALWHSLEDKKEAEKSSAGARLRRLLACQESSELRKVLRSTLRYLQSKGCDLDYGRLLHEILVFGWEERRERIRVRWAKEFFGPPEQKEGA